jgi:hypothetical protein
MKLGMWIIDARFSGTIFSLRELFSCQAILEKLDVLKAKKTFLCC